MDGYIIKRGNKFLTKGLFWYEHEYAKDAYVFSASEAADVMIYALGWELKPEKFIAATFENGKTIVTGE